MRTILVAVLAAVVLALAKMVHDVHEKQNVPNPL